jgi:hypothetical protein
MQKDSNAECSAPHSFEEVLQSGIDARRAKRGQEHAANRRLALALLQGLQAHAVVLEAD